MQMNEYQEAAKKTVIYPYRYTIYYPALGLVGEAGEVANKVKKKMRDGTELDTQELKSELGDVLWYIAILAEDLGLTLEEVADYNVRKLKDRKERSMLKGKGDNR